MKYHSTKTIVDGITFDSKKEAARYYELKMLSKNGFISNLELQKRFELQPKYKINGKSVKCIQYVCDFYYFDKQTQKWVVEDVKGYKTDIYKLKKKLFERKYEIEIKEV